MFVAVLRFEVRTLGLEIGDGLADFVREIPHFVILYWDVVLESCLGNGIAGVWVAQLDFLGFVLFLEEFLGEDIFFLCFFSNLFLMRDGLYFRAIGESFSASGKPWAVLAINDLTFHLFPLQNRGFPS